MTKKEKEKILDQLYEIWLEKVENDEMMEARKIQKMMKKIAK